MQSAPGRCGSLAAIPGQIKALARPTDTPLQSENGFAIKGQNSKANLDVRRRPLGRMSAKNQDTKGPRLYPSLAETEC